MQSDLIKDNKVLMIEKFKLSPLLIREGKILNLIFLLSFFPFFKFMPWLTAEVQPWGGVLAFLYLFFLPVKMDRLTVSTLAFLWLLLFIIFISLIIGRSPSAVVMLGGAYMLPLFILLALKDNAHLLSVKILYISILVYLVVGILQFFSLLVWVEPFIKYLIPGFLGSPHGVAGRGVNFLAQEPSGAGFIMVLMLSSASYFYLIQKLNRQALFAIFLAIIFMLALNKSGTAFLLIFFFFAVFFFMTFWYGRSAKKILTIFFIMPVIPLVAILVIFGVEYYSDSAKFILLLKKLFDFVKAGDLLTLASLAALSGGRFVTVFMGYASLFEKLGLGHGIASYQTEYSRLSDLLNIDWSLYLISGKYTGGDVHKPNSYGAQIALDMGITGLMIIILIAIFCWQQKGKGDYWRYEKKLNKSLLASIFATAIFIIFFRSTTSMPVAWVMLAYIYNYIKLGINKFKAERTILKPIINIQP